MATFDHCHLKRLRNQFHMGLFHPYKWPKIKGLVWGEITTPILTQPMDPEKKSLNFIHHPLRSDPPLQHPQCQESLLMSLFW